MLLKKVAVGFWHFSVCMDLSQGHMNVEWIVILSAVYLELYFMSSSHCMFWCCSNLLFPFINSVHGTCDLLSQRHYYQLDKCHRTASGGSHSLLPEQNLDGSFIAVQIHAVYERLIGSNKVIKVTVHLVFLYYLFWALKISRLCSSLCCMFAIPKIAIWEQNYSVCELTGTSLGFASWLESYLCFWEEHAFYFFSHF